MCLIYQIYACLRLRCLDVETTSGPWHTVPAVFKLFCSNLRGLFGNRGDLTVASSQYDTLLYSET